MKILYAAGNRKTASLQLERIYLSLSSLPNVKLKLAAYNISSPIGINIDWTLDPLQGVYGKSPVLTEDSIEHINYCRLIEKWGPDLIISDFERYTSSIGMSLGIPVWQVSPIVALFALKPKDVFKYEIVKRCQIFYNKNKFEYGIIKNMIENSQKKLIYSHIGDLKSRPFLKDGFGWCRPYFDFGDINANCEEAICCFMDYKNINMLKLIDRKNTIIFSNRIKENLTKKLKTMNDYSEYLCYLKNSKKFICDTQSSTLADAYYNGIKPFVYRDLLDLECIINYCMSKEHHLLNEIKDINNNSTTIKTEYQNCKQLHNYLEEQCI